jgi:hypothetical protein
VASRAECIAEIVGAGEVPDDEVELRNWLAVRGLGLVPIADPRSFEWPGPFLGRRADGFAVLFGVPPGTILGSDDGALEAAWVVAAHQAPPALAPRDAGTGVVEAIAVATAAQAPMQAVAAATAIAGAGLEGDRYARGAGTFSPGRSDGRDLTIVAAEALADAGVEPLESRRNVVVRGVDVDALRGVRFRIGDVELVGRRRCEPCAHLERLTRPGVLRALVHRGGLRADIVAGGKLRVGDEVAAL